LATKDGQGLHICLRVKLQDLIDQLGFIVGWAMDSRGIQLRGGTCRMGTVLGGIGQQILLVQENVLLLFETTAEKLIKWIKF
jgi:hypothetical protein